jgi:hypothetical protein
MPVKKNDYCVTCTKCIRKNQKGILCDFCLKWYHAYCVGMSNETYYHLSMSEEPWLCLNCYQLSLPFTYIDDDVFSDFFSFPITVPCKNASANLRPTKLTSPDNYLFSKTRFLDTSLKNDYNDSVNDLVTPEQCKYYDIDELNAVHVELGMKEHFTCLNLNCRSICKNFDSLCNMLLNLKCSFDVIVLTETWLSEATAVSYEISGYSMFCKHRSQARVEVYVYMLRIYTKHLSFSVRPGRRLLKQISGWLAK